MPTLAVLTGPTQPDMLITSSSVEEHRMLPEPAVFNTATVVTVTAVKRPGQKLPPLLL